VLYNLNINKRKDNNMYLIIKQTDFNNLDPMYTVEDQTTSLASAEKKGKGYELINEDKKVQFHCVHLKD
jgi:ABC-type glutathione transport system ATPase component